MGRLMFVVVVVLMLVGVAFSFSAKVNSKKNVGSQYKEMLWKRLLATLHEMDKQPVKQQNDVKARQYSGSGYYGSGYYGSGSYGSGSYGSGYYGSGSYGSGSYGSGYYGSGSYGSGSYGSGYYGSGSYGSGSYGSGYYGSGSYGSGSYGSGYYGSSYYGSGMGSGGYSSGMGSGYGSGHNTGHHGPPPMHGDDHRMSREQVLEFIISVFVQVIEKAAWELYEEEKCHENQDLGPDYKFDDEDSQYDVFTKMKNSFQALTDQVNYCSGETVFEPREIQDLIDLADWTYNYGGHEVGSLEELAMYYNYGKQEAESHAAKWDESCREFISALDCNMEHLHEEMMYYLEKKK